MIVPTPRVTPPNLAGILGLAQVVTDQNAVGTATVDGTTYPVNAAGQIVATAQVVGGKIVNNALPNIVAKPAGPTYAIPGSYNPTLSTTPGNQPNVTGGGGYEPVLTPESWLAANVVQPAAGNPTGQYMDPTDLATQLNQAYIQYCQGVSGGGPNNPCGGTSQASIVSGLVAQYTAQVKAQGGTFQPPGNAPQQFTQSAIGSQFSTGVPNLYNLPTTPGSTMPSWASSPAYSSGGGGGAAPAGQSATTYAIPGYAQPVPGTSASQQMTMINGASPAVTPLAAVPSWFTDPNQELISGVQNWMLAAAGVAGVVLLMVLKK